MIVIISKIEFLEYVGSPNCIEYIIKICRNYMYLTNPMWIKNKWKTSFLDIRFYKVRLKTRVTNWQNYPSCVIHFFSFFFFFFSMKRHYGFYQKHMIRHYVIHPTNWNEWMNYTELILNSTQITSKSIKSAHLGALYKLFHIVIYRSRLSYVW